MFNTFENIQRRKSYMAHLNSHNEQYISKFKCDDCDYRGVDNWNLSRHKKRKHRNTLVIVNAPVNEQPSIRNDKNSTSGTETMEPQIAELTENELVVNTVDDNPGAVDDHNIELRNGDQVSENDKRDEMNNEDNNENEIDNEINNEDEINNYEFDDWTSEDGSNDSEEVDDDIQTDMLTSSCLQNKPLSKYEQIRLDIIQEREQMIAESGIMGELSEAKDDLAPKRKVKKKKTRVNEETPLRRSGRNIPDTSTILNSADTDIISSDNINNYDADKIRSNTDNIASDSKSSLIKIEIKVELVDDAESDDRSDSDFSSDNLLKMVDQLLSDVLSKATKGTSIKYTCEKCSYVARDNHNLRRHKEVMHSKLVMQCLTCSNVFQEKSAFVDHRKTCSYTCSFDKCTKKFINKSKFDAHKRMHTNMLSRY